MDMKLVLRWMHSNKEQMHVKFSEYIGKILNWLNSMEDIYEGMDKEMDEITKKLQSLKIDERITEISKKMENVMKKLERINNTNKMI